MNRKFSALILSSASFFLLLSCKNMKVKADDEKEITLVMAEVNPAETIAGQMDYAFKTKVEELSKGKIKIDLHCSGILGDVDSVMELMLKPNSTIQIHRMSAVNMAMYGCKKSALLSVPFTFSSKEHFWRFANSESGQKILNEPVEAGLGLKGLFSRHDEKIELRLLPVGEKEVLADLTAQDSLHLFAGLDGIRVLVIHTVVFHAESIQELITTLLFRNARLRRPSAVQGLVNLHIHTSFPLTAKSISQYRQ